MEREVISSFQILQQILDNRGVIFTPSELKQWIVPAVVNHLPITGLVFLFSFSLLASLLRKHIHQYLRKMVKNFLCPCFLFCIIIEWEQYAFKEVPVLLVSFFFLILFRNTVSSTLLWEKKCTRVVSTGEAENICKRPEKGSRSSLFETEHWSHFDTTEITSFT